MHMKNVEKCFGIKVQVGCISNVCNVWNKDRGSKIIGLVCESSRKLSLEKSGPRSHKEACD